MAEVVPFRRDQVGQVDYDGPSHTWIPTVLLQQESESIVTHGATSHVAASKQSYRSESKMWDERRLQSRHIYQAFPEFGAASPLIKSLADSIYSIKSASLDDRPSYGNLLAFCTFHSKDPKSARYVCAMPVGSSGESLLLFRAKKGTGRAFKTWGLEIGERNSLRFDCQRGPIRQICFAEDVALGDPILAVRHARQIAVFEVLVNDKARPPFELGIVLQLDADMHDFTDLAFNPWNPKHFITIDNSGTIKQWHLATNNLNTTLELDQVLHPLGRLDASAEAPDIAYRWCRTLWSDSVHQILACDRHTLRTFSLRDASDSALLLSFDPQNQEKICSISRHGLHQGLVVVVTTIRLIVFGQGLSTEPIGTQRSPLYPSRKISVFHQRDCSDITLQSTLQKVQDDHFTVLLYSRRSPMASRYVFADQHVDKQACLILQSGPETFNMSGTRNEHQDFGWSIVSIFVAPEFFNNSHAAQSPSRLSKGFDKVLIGQIFTLGYDLSLKSLLISKRPVDRYLSLDAEADELTSSLQTLSMVLHRLPTSFVVDDETVQMQPLRNGLQPAQSGFLSTEYSQASRVHSRVKVYESLFASVGSGQRLSQVISLLASQQTILVNNGQLLAQFFQGTPSLDDTEATDVAITQLCNRAHDSPSLEVAALNLPGSKYTDEDAPPSSDKIHSVSKLYSHCIEHWISPLPDRTPSSTRLGRERVARQVVTAVILSSIRIQPRSAPRRATDTKETERDPLTADIGGSLSASKPDLESAASHVTSSNPEQLGTVQSTTPTGIKDPVTFAAQRLRVFTHILDPGVVKTSTEKSVANIIGSWNLGADPDVDATGDLIMTSNDLSSSTRPELRERDLRKLTRAAARAQRRESSNKRQRLDAERGAFSQPVLDRHGMLSSSQTQGQTEPSQTSMLGPEPVSQLQDETQTTADSSQAASMPHPFNVASQIQPGAYGGRLGAGSGYGLRKGGLGMPLRTKPPRKPGF